MSGLYLNAWNSIKLQIGFDTINTEGRNPCIPVIFMYGLKDGEGSGGKAVEVVEITWLVQPGGD